MPREYRTNGRIHVAEVRLIDDTGKQLGIMPTRQAMELAQDQGLDLVEVAPTAEPPVCQLLDYGKFRYELARRERIARRDQKAKASNVVREVRLKTRIGAHDRSAKTRQVKRLLEEGSKVKVSVMFRGREITHPEIGMAVLRLVAEDLAEDARMERPPTFEGRFLTMLLTPTPSNSPKPAQPPEPNGAKA